MGYSIRVGSGVIPIDVNDRGDTIELKTTAEFMKSCMRLQTNFQEGHREYQRVLDDEESTVEQQNACIDKLYADTDNAIDELFGARACEKVFGIDLSARNALQYVSFFDQMLAILDEQQSDRASQYIANREQRRAAKR